MKWFEHDKVRPLVFAPTVVHRGTGVVEERKGYTVRTRGDVDKLVPHEYECPVHGRFVREVVNHSVPSTVACVVVVRQVDSTGEVRWACSESSPWCGSSQVGIGISSGR